MTWNKYYKKKTLLETPCGLVTLQSVLEIKLLTHSFQMFVNGKLIIGVCSLSNLFCLDKSFRTIFFVSWSKIYFLNYAGFKTFLMAMLPYGNKVKSQPHKGHFTYKISSKTVPILPFLDPSLIFPFHLLPSPVHPTGFSFCFFTGFLAIFISLSSNNILTVGQMPSEYLSLNIFFWI